MKFAQITLSLVSETLRLKAAPARVTSGTTSLAIVNEPSAEGYTVKPLGSGDVAVRIHHRFARHVKVTLVDQAIFRYDGAER